MTPHPDSTDGMRDRNKVLQALLNSLSSIYSKFVFHLPKGRQLLFIIFYSSLLVKLIINVDLMLTCLFNDE